MEPKEEKLDKWQKYQLILALIATALLAVLVGTQAWLTYVRKLQTAAVVDMPNLIIQGPLDSDTAPLELGDIDVTAKEDDGEYHRKYVFSITAVNAEYYKLQLAHTTNIPFTYTIYPAEMENLGGRGTHKKEEGNYTYWYTADQDHDLPGIYLNQDGSKANRDYHEQTYGTYPTEYVQPNAEPLYWQSNSVQADRNNVIRHYYILDISWEEGLKNNKETDMVYLTVEVVENEQTSGTGGSQ